MLANRAANANANTNARLAKRIDLFSFLIVLLLVNSVSVSSKSLKRLRSLSASEPNTIVDEVITSNQTDLNVISSIKSIPIEVVISEILANKPAQLQNADVVLQASQDNNDPLKDTLLLMDNDSEQVNSEQFNEETELNKQITSNFDTELKDKSSNENYDITELLDTSVDDNTELPPTNSEDSIASSEGEIDEKTSFDIESSTILSNRYESQEITDSDLNNNDKDMSVQSEENPSNDFILNEVDILSKGQSIENISEIDKDLVFQSKDSLEYNKSNSLEDKEDISLNNQSQESKDYNETFSLPNLNQMTDNSDLEGNEVEENPTDDFKIINNLQINEADEVANSIQEQDFYDNKENERKNFPESESIETASATEAIAITTLAQRVQPAAEPASTSTTNPMNLPFKPINTVSEDKVVSYINTSTTHPIVIVQQLQQQSSQLTQLPEEQQHPDRRYDGAQVWRIVVENDREKLLADQLQIRFDGQVWKEVRREVDYMLKPHVLAAAESYVRATNLSHIVLIENVQKVIDVENPPKEQIASLQNRKGHRLTWQAYHRLEDIHGFFDYLAKTYPDICTVETIGYSLQKRPLKILKISNGNESNPGIWIDGGIHAREWISPATVTYITNVLVEGWDDLPSHFRNINWYMHPVVNPDGYEYSHTTDRLWRKNLRSHGRICPGVDLNRNFGYMWGGRGSSANPCSQTYRGGRAFSEPETFYISKFITSYPKGTFKAYISFHSYGQYILYPWGYDYHISPDMTDLDLLGRQAGTRMTKGTGVKYTVGSAAITLYPASGGADDWAKGFADIKYSYTVELGDTGRYGFVLPAKFIDTNAKDGFAFVETLSRIITGDESSSSYEFKSRKLAF